MSRKWICNYCVTVYIHDQTHMYSFPQVILRSFKHPLDRRPQKRKKKKNRKKATCRIHYSFTDPVCALFNKIAYTALNKII